MNDQNQDDFEFEEIDEDEEEPHHITHPFDPHDIDISVEQQNIGFLLDKLEFDEIALNTEFQRSPDLWSREKMSRLIESILIKFPLPAFYFDSSESGNSANSKWQVVDGLQRLSSLKKFAIDNTLVLQGLEFLTQLDGKRYSDLTPATQRALKGAQATIYRIRPGTPTQVKYLVFKRVNTGGLTLTNQEIRHAINQGVPADFVEELAELDSFKSVVRVRTHRMQDRELALRYVAFRLTPPENFRPSMVRFLDEAMITITRTTPDQRESLKCEFDESIIAAREIFKSRAFSKTTTTRYLFNKAIFEAWVVNLSLLQKSERQKLTKNSDKVKLAFEILEGQDDFNRSISRSTAELDTVKTRFRRVRELIQNILTTETDD